MLKPILKYLQKLGKVAHIYNVCMIPALRRPRRDNCCTVVAREGYTNEFQVSLSYGAKICLKQPK